MMVEGATPNVTSSARESSSFPIGDEMCNALALMPSKKSNPAPMIIQSNARSGLAKKAKQVAMQPDMRLHHVRILGKLISFVFSI